MNAMNAMNVKSIKVVKNVNTFRKGEKVRIKTTAEARGMYKTPLKTIVIASMGYSSLVVGAEGLPHTMLVWNRHLTKA